MRRIGGALLAVTGFLACPCHLIITLPLLLSLLAGTALGSFLSHNIGLVYAGASVYFIVALAAGVLLLTKRRRTDRQSVPACPTCIPADVPAYEARPSAREDDQPVTRR
jgi:mercuric ion transport protein